MDFWKTLRITEVWKENCVGVRGGQAYVQNLSLNERHNDYSDVTKSYKRYRIFHMGRTATDSWRLYKDGESRVNYQRPNA